MSRSALVYCWHPYIILDRGQGQLGDVAARQKIACSMQAEVDADENMG
jgi:hypothetical protein